MKIRPETNSQQIEQPSTSYKHLVNYFVSGIYPSILHISYEGFRTFLDMRDPDISVHYIQNGNWEPHVIRYYTEVFVKLKDLYNNNNISFIDIGANIGLHSINAKKIGYEVISFEPDPVTYQFLELNTRMNGLHCVLHKLAVSNENGKLEFKIDKRSSGMSRLARIHESNRTDQDHIEVKVSTFDNLILDEKLEPPSNVAVIKIDTEGFEGEAIEGMTNYLNQLDSFIIIAEWHLDNSKLRDQLFKLIAMFKNKDRIMALKLLRFEKDEVLLDLDDIDSWYIESGDIALEVLSNQRVL